MEYNEMAEYASKIPHHQPTFMISMVQHYEFKVYGKFTVSSNESAIINNSNTSTTNTNNTNNTNTNNNSNNSNSNGNGKESNVNIVGGGVVLENRVKVIVEEYKDKQIVVI